MNVQPHLIEESNISIAWAKVILRLHSTGVTEISPLVVTINLPQGKAVEIPSIRKVIDEELAKHDREDKKHHFFSSETTANTIFPKSLWSPGVDRHDFYARYKRLLPRLKSHPRNKMGIYFERLLAFGGDNNQLEHMLASWEKGNRRRSEFQAITVNPAEDQSDMPMRGFPCLRQVMFIPTKEGLVVSGIYGVQYAFDRAYGNYLGLCHLGEFMAHEMELPLVRLQCVTTIAELGTTNKTKLDGMAQTLLDVLKQEQPLLGNLGNRAMLKRAGSKMNLSFEEELYAQTR